MDITLPGSTHELAERITEATGCDPHAPEFAGTFQLSDAHPCDRCHKVTATAALADGYDGEPARLCIDCCEWA